MYNYYDIDDDLLYCPECMDKHEELNWELASSHDNYGQDLLLKWRKENKELYKRLKQEYDPAVKLIKILRSRINAALKNNPKTIHTVDSFGCPVHELIQHLEKQFQSGMSWDNHSIRGWHVDHIRPLSSFDFSNPEDQLKANHYTNLRPLWAKDNLSKGNRWGDNETL